MAKPVVAVCANAMLAAATATVELLKEQDQEHVLVVAQLNAKIAECEQDAKAQTTHAQSTSRALVNLTARYATLLAKYNAARERLRELGDGEAYKSGSGYPRQAEDDDAVQVGGAKEISLGERAGDGEGVGGAHPEGEEAP